MPKKPTTMRYSSKFHREKNYVPVGTDSGLDPQTANTIQGERIRRAKMSMASRIKGPHANGDGHED